MKKVAKILFIIGLAEHVQEVNAHKTIEDDDNGYDPSVNQVDSE
jgi:hypothetical protein